MTLLEFLKDIYSPLRGICEKTEYLYVLTIEEYSRHLERPATLEDLEEIKIARFLAKRVRERAAATAAKDRSQLRAMWELAARRGLVATWPEIRRIKVPERVPEAWLSTEMSSLIEACGGEKAAYCGIPAAMWWRAVLLVCYDTGERCGSVLSLRWQDVRDGMVVFRAENRKGGTRDLSCELSASTAASVAAIRFGRRDEDLVFPWPRTHSYLWRRLEIILQRAGLPSGRKHKFHKIRKTTASYAEAAGVSAQKVLDHSDPSVTRAYLDPRIVKTPSASRVIPSVVDPATAPRERA